MKRREASALRVSDADDVIMEALMVLQSACEQKGVRAHAVLVAIVTQDGMGCRSAVSPTLCREKKPDMDGLSEEVNQAMKKFVEGLTGVTIHSVPAGESMPS